MGKGPDKPKETAEQRAAAEIAQDQWNVYKTQYRPTEQKWVKDITSPTAARESRMEAQTSADTAQRYTRGIDPTRLKTFAPVNADTAGKFQVANNQAVKNQRLQGMQAAVDLGMGKASDVSLGFQQAASNSVTKQLADEENSQLVKDTAVSAGMQLLGAGARAGMSYAKGPSYGDTIKGADGPMTYIGKSGQGMQHWNQR
jgi:hypothetical protein